MLNENEKLIQLIKEQHKMKFMKTKKLEYWFHKCKWVVVYLIMAISLFFIIFYPVQAGTLIGMWAGNFFGSIYKNFTY